MKDFYVKKIVSWNPDEYKYIPLDMALKAYDDYLHTLFAHVIQGHGFTSLKSFEIWLETEI